MDGLSQLIGENFGRFVPYRTARRIRENLLKVGIKEEEFSEALQVMALFNKDKTGAKFEKIRFLDYNFLTQYRQFVLTMSKYNSDKFECFAFIRALLPESKTKSLKVLESNSSILYQWFIQCGLTYQLGQIYPAQKLIPVALLLFQWVKNQSTKNQESNQ